VSFAHYIKEISNSVADRRDLSEQEADALFAAMLDGGVPELELGAVLLAYRMKSESLPELLGFHNATAQRVFRLKAPSGQALPIILPSYGGAREQPNLLPLLALLLQRFGIRVLVHGVLNGSGHVASAYVFRELGMMPCANLAQAQEVLDRTGVAFVPTAVLAPGLAELLSLRGRLGVRSSAHIVAKLIDPFESGGLRVIGASYPPYLERLREFLSITGTYALLLRSTEGEPFANPRHRPRIEFFHDHAVELLFDAEVGALKNLPNLPIAVDAPTTAAWIRQVLAGEVPVPLPIVNQLACCLYAAGYSPDLNQAKAVVAVETGGLAAA
jgi:anthranilate phosphoribosyltransferase